MTHTLPSVHSRECHPPLRSQQELHSQPAGGTLSASRLSRLGSATSSVGSSFKQKSGRNELQGTPKARPLLHVAGYCSDLPLCLIISPRWRPVPVQGGAGRGWAIREPWQGKQKPTRMLSAQFLLPFFFFFFKAGRLLMHLFMRFYSLLEPCVT